MGVIHTQSFFGLNLIWGGEILVILIVVLTLMWISSTGYESKFVLVACNSWGFRLFLRFLLIEEFDFVNSLWGLE